MGFSVKILADSLHPNATDKAADGLSLRRGSGLRLTTMELTYPRIIHSEFMTHRQFSRNAASSRAIPVEKMLERIDKDPFIPIEWGTNQKGMVAAGPADNPVLCEDIWLSAKDDALVRARQLLELNLHKQIINRLVEPWMWITVIATGVDHAWENFFKLRCAPDAEPHIQRLAYMARDAFDAATPTPLKWSDFHLPLIGLPGDEGIGFEVNPPDLPKISVARCARVSYLTHDDGRRDLNEDIRLFERLRLSGHWSPFEHVAAPRIGETRGGNYGTMWRQYRKLYQDEYCTKAPR